MLLNSKCKKCRRVGQKLFLKGERCFSQKCAMIRKPYSPGNRGKARFRKRSSEYGAQLAEKQKIRWSYGVSEEQLKKYFREVSHRRGNKKELLAAKLESRLDNIVFRLGLAKSRRSARQIINHGHILVNARKVDIPSFSVKKGDVIKLKKSSLDMNLFKDLKTLLKKQETPKWLSLNVEKMEGKAIDKPAADDTGRIGELNMVIEFYSR